MSLPLDDNALRAEFSRCTEQYADPLRQKWRQDYSAQVDFVRNASSADWMTPTFQERLWTSGGVAGIGPGSSVSVSGAYVDEALAAYLFKLRDQGLSDDPQAAAVALQSAYDQIMGMVRPKHTAKRPRARIVRVLAAIFPHHMTCLMDERRTLQVQRLICAGKAPTDFVGQNALIRERIREALGEAGDDIEQAMFCWFLWQTHFSTPEPGAVEAVGVGREPVDVPEFSILPATSQRRSLFAVQNNLRLLVSMVRECEQGISKDDLVNLIQQEAVNLSEASAVAVINQALGGGLGLIRYSDGAYYPTDRGIELLNAPEPGHILRAPLIGRVYGMAHLLLRLLHHGSMSQQDAAAYLQSLVPTWKTSMPGSYIVLWAKLAGLVRGKVEGGKTQLSLTDDGEDYASALPADFEGRWQIVDELSDDDSVEDIAAALTPASTAAPTAYDAAAIVAEGCFLPEVEIRSMLGLLRHKKNLVLQGPPGTGKTWLAKRLGYALVGAKDPSRVMAVQFQPSLSYEDFVRGWRPYAGKDGQGGLRLTDGVFLECIQAATASPDQDFVLVIEEINRGNPAQILGELLTLLEADKRIESEALRLAYPRFPDERVYVPKNLYVIGTMNIADRSLALVDLALRRRFAFQTLGPALNGAWRAWCVRAGAPATLIEAVHSRMEALNEAIAADSRLRSQFCIGHSFVTPPEKGVPDWTAWFHGVVETELSPLLDEYWYDDEPAARAQKAKLRLPI